MSAIIGSGPHTYTQFSTIEGVHCGGMSSILIDGNDVLI